MCVLRLRQGEGGRGRSLARQCQQRRLGLRGPELRLPAERWQESSPHPLCRHPPRRCGHKVIRPKPFELKGIRDRIYSFCSLVEVSKKKISVGVRPLVCYCKFCISGLFSECAFEGAGAFMSVVDATKSVTQDKRKCHNCKGRGHTARHCPEHDDASLECSDDSSDDSSE